MKCFCFLLAAFSSVIMMYFYDMMMSFVERRNDKGGREACKDIVVQHEISSVVIFYNRH